MHIPDGYLSPATSVIMFFIILPFWVMGVRKLREKMTSRNVPTDRLDRGFLVHHHDVQRTDPGGTTSHAVGGALAAIILGLKLATMGDIDRTGHPGLFLRGRRHPWRWVRTAQHGSGSSLCQLCHLPGFLRKTSRPVQSGGSSVLRWGAGPA